MQVRLGPRLIAGVVIFIFLIYIPLNVIYILFTTSFHRSVRDFTSGVDTSKWDMSMSIKDVIPHPDGTVDILMSMNVHDLMKIVDNQKHEMYKGEETPNALPVNFTWVLNKPEYCSTSPSPQWIIYVHTAPANVERRMLLRNTWANNQLFKDGRTKTIFLMGTPDNVKDQAIIRKEYEQYNDIVQGSFLESYKNLTIKGIMGLRWVSEFCPQAKFALKADDDAYVNLFKLMSDIMASPTAQNNKNVVACPLWKDNTMPILRDPKKCMKWCVKYSEFPKRTHFPRYCAGLAFVLSASIVPQMYQHSKTTPFFWIDDVYITGLLTGKVKDVSYIDYLKHFTLKEDLVNTEYTSNSTDVKYYFSHVKKMKTFERIWNGTLWRLDDQTLESLSPNVLKLYPHLMQRIKKE